MPTQKPVFNTHHVILR